MKAMNLLWHFLILGISQPAFAKCWAMREFPTTYCATFVVNEVVKVPGGSDCILKARVAKAQHLDFTSTRRSIRENDEIKIGIEDGGCKRYKAKAKHKKLLTASCHDVVGPPEMAPFLDDYYVNTEGWVGAGGLGTPGNWDGKKVSCK